MIEFIAVNMAPIMFASLIVFLLLGYPVAFSLAANGLLFFVIGVELAPLSNGNITLSWPLLYALPERFYGGVMANETLLAIPFFTFMGIVLERSGMAEDLLDTIGQLFGPIRGGLAYAVILVGALLAATTGVVAASVIAMGLISLPIMLRYGYDRRIASGVDRGLRNAGADHPALARADRARRPARPLGRRHVSRRADPRPRADRALHALHPVHVDRAPEIHAGLAAGSAHARARSDVAAGGARRRRRHQLLRPHTAVADAGRECRHPRRDGRRHRDLHRRASRQDDGFGMMSRLAQQVIIVLIPPLALIFLVLGTIFLGIATPTEGGAMGAVGALILAAAKGRLNLDVMKQALASTTRLSSFVMFILIGARVFSLTFYGVNGHLWVEHLLVLAAGRRDWAS
jgi:TRAP-type mannitol/chloroaromatic compound transport system permease large subunit